MAFSCGTPTVIITGSIGIYEGLPPSFTTSPLVDLVVIFSDFPSVFPPSMARDSSLIEGASFPLHYYRGLKPQGSMRARGESIILTYPDQVAVGA